jgi:DnaJ-domain-containing protein 1
MIVPERMPEELEMMPTQQLIQEMKELLVALNARSTEISRRADPDRRQPAAKFDRESRRP